MKLLSALLGLCAIASMVGCSSEPAVSPGPGGGQAGTGVQPAGGQNPGGGGGAPGVSGSGSNTAGTAQAGTGPSVGGSAPVAGSGGSSVGGNGSVGGTGSNGGASVGGSSAGGSGPNNVGKSAGCGRQEPLQQPPREYVQHDIIVDVAAEYQPDYTTREYHTWLPDNYDPNTAYPLYFWGNGCGVSKGNPEGIPVANITEVKTGAILVFMIPEDGCFDAGKGGKANTPDVPYFEKMLNDVEAEYCVDQGKVFVGGYSSSAWFAATLSCSHGNRLNGIGMAAGGQQDELPMCTGPAALILWAGNEGATGNPIDTPPNVAWEGSGAVRDRLIAADGCAQTTTKWDPKWPSCNLYDNCGKNPVVFCPHGGGHDTGGPSGVNAEGFWKLFKSTW